MTGAIFGTMLGYMAISSFTPGPGNILAMNTTNRFGWKDGKRLILGICCGYLCVQTFCTFTLYELNAVLAPILSVLKYIGGVYMIWLSIHIIRSHPIKDTHDGRASFRTGLLLQLVNVKIYFYITTLLSAYLIPNIDSLGWLLLAGLGVVAVGSTA